MPSPIRQHDQDPRIAVAMGCPAGIAPELTARLLADEATIAAAAITVIGDRRVLEAGARSAGVAPRVRIAGADNEMPAKCGEPVLLDIGHLDPATIETGRTSLSAGRFALENFRHAIRMAAAGETDVVAWTPFNKAAMRLAHSAYEDEIVFASEMLNFKGTASEFNILPKIWNARVTSHVPLSKVAELITFDSVMRGLQLTDRAMRMSGFAAPRIAVAALNPHAGDGGNFGREEIDIIAPVVEAARRKGIACDGPFPSDTVFVRAQKGEFDAVLTMYHDQGQIAMKLIGFEEGVTLLGGFPFPLVTPAHGSAYDIAGKGIAHPGATLNAIRIAARMAAARARARQSAAMAD
jgi:4-hydroxythreonine-4-phosphate dehydrogenase